MNKKSSNNIVKVWLGVVVKKNNKLLLGKRFGKWCFPGGHLEFGEEFKDCAKREMKEEVGIKIKNIRFSKITNDVMRDKHYISIFMEADYVSGEPKVLEPDKCDEWKWFGWSNLPDNLFVPVTNYLKIRND